MTPAAQTFLGGNGDRRFGVGKVAGFEAAFLNISALKFELKFAFQNFKFSKVFWCILRPVRRYPEGYLG